MDAPQAKWRRLLAALVLAASVAAIAVVPSLASPRAGGQELLPDLDQRVPKNVTVAANGGGWDLNFDSAVDNMGDGPLYLKGSRGSTLSPTMDATQQVQTSTGETIDQANSGTLRYVQSPDHEHWHLDGFDRYELRKARSGELVGPDRKTGFCLGDRYDADPDRTLPNKPARAVLTGQCERNNADALSVTEGISVGYGDEYKGGLEGQSIEVTGVPAGRYVLVHRVNADGKLEEKTDANNAASVLIQLSWPGGPGQKPAVQVLARCPDTATCEASPAAGSTGPVTPATVVASGLDTPWEVLPLPDGRVLVSELPGRVRAISQGGTLQPTPVYSDPDAVKFLGMALDPGYATNRFVYVYVTRADGSRVIRLTDIGAALTGATPIYQGIATDGRHDGGRMAFGPDDKLYVTTGDIHDPALPRDRTSPNGKILRMNADGSAPADNPFAGEGGAAPYVWSYGHRHPQGIGWDSLGRMWESEHGPSGEAHAPAGAKTGNDEINRIEPGRDYGWPAVAGDQTLAGTTAPVAHAGATAWAPGGLAFAADGRMYLPFLAGTELRGFTTSGEAVTGQTTFYDGTYGRLRTAVADGSRLWLTTSNNTRNERVLCVLVAIGTACPGSGSAPAGGASGSTPPQQSGAPAAAAPVAGSGSAAATGPSRAQVVRTLDALLARQVKGLRRRSVAQLRAMRRLTLRDRALPAKRLSLELSTRSASGRRRLAAGAARTGTGRAVAVRMELFRSPLGALRRRRPPRLTLTAALRTADGRLISRAASFRPR